jgi:FkbM family methyltransferase
LDEDIKLRSPVIKSLVKKWLLRHNIVLSRPPGQFNVGAFKLRAARDRGLKVNLAVDGGASNGGWTREFRVIFPDARILCIEPREDTQDNLKAMAAELGNIEIAQTLIGSFDGEIEYHQQFDQSSILPNHEGRFFGRRVKGPITTLDALISKMNLPEPDLIKLDLQGAELMCLQGATRALKHAKAIQLEVSFIEFQKGMPLAADVIAFMAARRFRLYDIIALWHRPLDGALVQGDFLFLSESSELLSDRRWSSDAKKA